MPWVRMTRAEEERIVLSLQERGRGGSPARDEAEASLHGVVPEMPRGPGGWVGDHPAELG